MDKKRISFTLEPEWYEKWRQIAREEYRTLPKQTAIAVKAYIRQYEQKEEPDSSCKTP